MIKRLIVLCLLSLLNMSTYSESSPGLKGHSKYYLNVGHFEGSFIDEAVEEFTLYDRPSKKGKIVATIKTKDYDHPASFLKLFDDGKSVFYFMSISSMEFKNNFYKVFYNGKYLWAPKENFYRTMPIEAYIDKVSFYLNKEAELFDKPNGEKLKIDYKAILEEKEDLGYVEILESKYVKGRLWLKIQIKSTEVCGDLIEFDKVYDAWVSPYDDNGKPLWVYPHGGC